LYAGLSLALGTRFWSQTIIPEVYATLMFWLSLSTLLGLIWLRGRQVVVLLAAALCLGLGTGAHLTILALVPAALLAGWTTPDRGAGGSSLAGAVAAFTFGAAIHGLLPIWAARDTLPSWGDQRTLAGLWAHISGAEYRYLAGIVPWSQRIGRLSFAARDLLSQPGLLGLALAAFIGIPSAWEQNRPFMLGTALVALSSLFFAISYGGADGTVYLLPWTWAWSIWAGFGVKAAMDMRGRLIPAPVAIAVMTLVLVGTLGWTAIRQHTTHNLRADVSARDTAVAELERLPAGAILVTADDAQTFGAWYVQRALNIRPDIVIVDSRLLARAWYRTQIRRVLKTAPGVTVCAAVAASGRPMFLAGNDLTTPADAVLEEACVRWEE
jgi:hypothetical protein